jgi:thymidylate synthase
MANNIDKQYQDLLRDILYHNNPKVDRTGTGTISVFGRQIRHKMSEGFPLLTTKKMPFKTMVTELLWFLKGDTNIKYLVDNNCHIWDGDAYKNYMQQYNVVDAEEYSKGYEDQCWGYPVLDHVKPTTASYKRGQINAYLEGKADKPFFYLTQEEFINKIKNDNEFAKKWGELGPIYGKQWRAWGRKNVVNYDLENVKSSDRVKVMDLIRDGGDYSKYDVKVTYQNNSIDQIAILINELKTNPDSRRLMVNAWNVGELDQMVLPPCHYGFQFYTRELSEDERNEIRDMQYLKNNLHQALKGSDTKIDWENIPTRAISLMWNQRSVDTFLGLPFNIASYALLLEIIAKEVNMVPDELIGNLGDVHLYNNHIDQAKLQIERTPFELPKLKFNPIFLANLEHKGLDEAINGQVNFELENYKSHPSIKAPLSN